MAIGKRPDRKNYAMYDARGAAKYKKDLAAYLKKKAEAERTKNKLSTEKNIKKQKTANKKATTTTKTTKGKTSAKPTSTAAKGKSLATGKTTSKTKAVETPKTKTATKTRTRTRTQTKSKTTTKTTPESKVTPKTTPKTTTKSKTTGKTTPKRKPFDPQKRGRGRPVGSKNEPKRKPFDSVDSGKRKPFDSVNSKNKPKGNQTLQIKEVAKQTKELAGKTVDKTKEGVKNFKNKANKFFDPAKPNAPATTRAQKFFSKAGKKLGKGLSTAKNYTKTQVLPKLGRDALKILKNNPASTLKSAGKAGIGVVGQLAVDQLGDRAFRALRGENKKSLKQFREERDKEMGKRGLMRLRPKNIGKTINSLRGKGDNPSTQSSTTTTNKSNNTNKNNKLKVKKDNNSLANQIKVAKKRVRNASGYNKEKLQREVDYLEKFGKQPRTWSNPYGAKGGGRPSSVDSSKSSSTNVKRGKSSIEDKNRARFGDAHVNKLKNKQRDFKLLKKKKMTKKEFIRRYPKSITAQRAAGLR